MFRRLATCVVATAILGGTAVVAAPGQAAPPAGSTSGYAAQPEQPASATSFPPAPPTAASEVTAAVAATALTATWSSARSGLPGVEAGARLSRRGTQVHLTGRLRDTAADRRTVRLDIRPTGGCCIRVVRATGGAGTSVPIDVTVRARHVAVREVLVGPDGVLPGAWVRLF